MLTEYTFSPPPTDGQPVEQVSLSSVLGAAALAWAISLLRLVLAVSHHETGLDPTLAALAVAAIPWIALAVWRRDSRCTSLPMTKPDEIQGAARRSPSVRHLRRVTQ